jgi:hypothetical protein
MAHAEHDAGTDDGLDLSPQWSEAKYRRMDDRFCGAMRAGINAGMEHAKIGVNTAPMTDLARLVHPSGTGRLGNCCLADA